ncbi:MAG: class C beta-lactamase-related serine hydrolase, partial [Acetobacteraceae bacterium]
VLLGRAIGRPLSDYLAEKIWGPAGMEADGHWMLDAQGREIGGCCVSATLRDWGRVGLMVLDGGETGGTAVVGPDWFAQATTEQADIGEPGMGYGYQWWTYDDGRYGARGIFGQAIQIDPSRKLVIVLLSAWPTAVGEARSAARTALFDRITAAVDAAP